MEPYILRAGSVATGGRRTDRRLVTWKRRIKTLSFGEINEHIVAHQHPGRKQLRSCYTLSLIYWIYIIHLSANYIQRGSWYQVIAVLDMLSEATPDERMRLRLKELAAESSS